MAAHGGEARVQEQACGALWNLTSNSEAGKRAAIEAGGVAAVVRAMEAHGGEAGVQEQACGALVNLMAGSEAGRRAVREAGGVAALERALRGFPTHAEICRLARKALGCFLR